MSKNTKRKRNVPPPGPPDPPLETLADLLDKTDQHVEAIISHVGPPDELREFAQRPPVDLDLREYGNMNDMLPVFANVELSDTMIRRMITGITDRGVRINPRTDAAADNVLASKGVFLCALLTHLREGPFYAFGTCILLRTTVELCARAIYIAVGTGNEVTAFHRGDRTQIVDVFRVVTSETAKRWKRAGDPYAVYRWLCTFGHFNAKAMRSIPIPTEDVYAAMAYASWMFAAATEIISGETNIAAWPRFPPKLPW